MVCKHPRAKFRHCTTQRFGGDRPRENKQTLKYLVDVSQRCVLQLNFVVSDYMSRQPEMSVNMRAVLVDWLDEVQQSFELVHETLYLAVKLTDYYLDRQTTTVQKKLLQLIGSTALNIACKFEVYIFCRFYVVIVLCNCKWKVACTHFCTRPCNVAKCYKIYEYF